tara:strand:+ start:184 stop:714 length:531 start_codon:yes stop_codon:yes gene_type:complete
MPFTLLPTSAYSTLDATKLTGNLPAINGSSLTNLPSADNEPCFMAWGGNQSISNETVTVLAMGTANWNLGSKYDTSTYRFTPAAAGHYWICANVQYTSQGGGAARSIMQLFKNDTPFTAVETEMPDGTKTNVFASALINVDSDDYITAQVYQNSGSALTTNNSSGMTFMMGFKVIT